MTLRNAFDGLATESGLRRIANLLTFARDNSDRIRTTVDNVVSVAPSSSTTGFFTHTANNSGGLTASTVLPFGGNGWNAQDARETTRLQMANTSAFIKKNRWTY